MALDFYSAVDLKCGMFRSQEGSVDTASMHARLKQITDLGVPRNGTEVNLRSSANALGSPCGLLDRSFVDWTISRGQLV